jgi:4-amino-4-deoxy-L-arabinose transferase-like glycosyltransferase
LVLASSLAVRLSFFGGLLGWDDVQYSEAARRLAAGEYTQPTPFGLRYPLILPLAASQALFGINEPALFVVPLVYSLAGLVLIYALGALYGGPKVGLTAAGLLAVFPLDVMLASDLHADLPMSVFMAATVYCVKRGEMAGADARRWFLLAGLAMGLTQMSKEVGLVVGAVLLARLAWLRCWRPAYGWLGVGFTVVLLGELAWYAALTGQPLFPFSAEAGALHTRHMQRISPSYGWMLAYPGMLLNPLHVRFGHFAGYFYLVMAATIWGLSRRDRTVGELTLWWGTILTLLNFAPLDTDLERPLYIHFARTLHPVFVPGILAAAYWLVRGLHGQRVWQVSIVIGLVPVVLWAMWVQQFDHRQWASVARQAAAVIANEPTGTLVASDPLNTGALRILLPERRERMITASFATPRDQLGSGHLLVLHDPLLLNSAVDHGYDVPAWLLHPPPHWVRLGDFTRPRRISLRERLIEIMPPWLGLEPARGGAVPIQPASLWRVTGPGQPEGTP